MSRTEAETAADPAIAKLLATLSHIPAWQARRIGKLHAWLPSGRVFFVWDGHRYRARPEVR